MWPFRKKTTHPKVPNIPSELFPPDFPSELRVAAFRADNEAAWPPVLAVAAVEWFGTHGYGVFGTELWLLTWEYKLCRWDSAECEKYTETR
jgi:hypothetical protein